ARLRGPAVHRHQTQLTTHLTVQPTTAQPTTDGPMERKDLLAGAGPAPTHLPTDPGTELLRSGVDPAEVAARYPSSSAAWAALAERAYGQDEFVAAYAYARTGYHRGLDQLRRAGR